MFLEFLTYIAGKTEDIILIYFDLRLVDHILLQRRQMTLRISP